MLFMRLIPDVSPKTFTFSAVIIGYLLIDDLTANEQNALGNWLMLVAQILCTNAYYKQVQTERVGGTNANQDTPSTNETIYMMEKMMCAMQKEIEELKKASFHD